MNVFKAFASDNEIRIIFGDSFSVFRSDSEKNISWINNRLIVKCLINNILYPLANSLIIFHKGFSYKE